MKLKHKFFAIDFDGTIAYDAYPGIGNIIPGAKETMLKIKELGGEIAIWTCRTHAAKENAKKFLDANNIPYDKFNEPFDANVNEYGGDHARKIFADVYIDDRSIHLEGKPVNWEDIQKNIFTYDYFQIGDKLEAITHCGFRQGSIVEVTNILGDFNGKISDYIIDDVATMPADGVHQWFRKVD
jgi:hypothetical protein